MVNTGGAPGVWRALEAYGQQHLETEAGFGNDDEGTVLAYAAKDVIILLDTQMSANESAGLKRTAAIRGYKMYDCAGRTESKKQNDANRGGIICLAKKHLKQKWIHSDCTDLAQMLVVRICGWHIIGSYAPPQAHEEHVQLFLSTMNGLKLDQEADWCWGADHNEPLENSVLAATAETFQGMDVEFDSKHKDQPTRWLGRKKIDFFMTNRPKRARPVRMLDEKISDHIAMQCDLTVDASDKCKIGELQKFKQLREADLPDERVLEGQAM